MKPAKDLSEFSPTKTCTGCGQDKPRTPEHFEPCRARTVDGLRSRCRDCERARDAEYRRRKRAERKAANNG